VAPCSLAFAEELLDRPVLELVERITARAPPPRAQHLECGRKPHASIAPRLVVFHLEIASAWKTPLLPGGPLAEACGSRDRRPLITSTQSPGGRTNRCSFAPL